MFGVTVPDFGFGIFCARTRPSSLPIVGHHVGRRNRDVEVGEAGFDLFDQVVFADEIGAGGFASRSLSPRANAMTRTVRPVPCGRLTVPRTF
jgi:hypothetical protein